MKRNLIKISVIFGILLISFFVIFYFFKQEIKETKENSILLNTNKSEVSDTPKPDRDLVPIQKKLNNSLVSDLGADSNLILQEIVLEAGNISVNLTFEEGQSLYQILEKAKGDKKISFEGQDYSGLGFFVNEIAGLKSGNGKYLFYYVNGVEAQVGVSNYYPKSGEIISWQLK